MYQVVKRNLCGAHHSFRLYSFFKFISNLFENHLIKFLICNISEVYCDWDLYGNSRKQIIKCFKHRALFAIKHHNHNTMFVCIYVLEVNRPVGPRLLVCVPLGILTLSFAPFGRSGHVTHAPMHQTTYLSLASSSSSSFLLYVVIVGAARHPCWGHKA